MKDDKRASRVAQDTFGTASRLLLTNNGGSLIMLTILVTVVISALTLEVLNVSLNSLYLGRKQMYTAQALNAAEAGADRATLWLKNQTTLPTTLVHLYTNASVGNASYSVDIVPYSGNSSATNYLKIFYIQSTGSSGGIDKKVEIKLRQATFGRYAYFTDKETSSSGSTIWWKTGEICDGPAHSNNTSNSPFSINYTNSTSPIFLDMVTACGSSITYSPSTPNNETTFRKIYASGSSGYQLGIPRIELPASSDIQKNAAWGSTSGFPTTNGVYMQSNSNGGIYIRGDAAIQMQRDSSGRQLIVVTQGTNVTTITADLSAKTTTVSGPVGTGSPTTSSSPPNGVIYCTGNITSLKGEITDNKVQSGAIQTRSAWTIATDVNAGNDITITDSLYYHTRPDKTKPSTDAVNLAAGTLGLVACDINIASGAPQNLEIDAVCLAGGENTASGSFSVANYSTKTPVGTLSVIGGIIQKARGAVGTFNSSTGTTSTGYTKNYHYDPRLASDPPPFYPTTGTFERLSWQAVVTFTSS